MFPKIRYACKSEAIADKYLQPAAAKSLITSDGDPLDSEDRIMMVELKLYVSLGTSFRLFHCPIIVRLRCLYLIYGRNYATRELHVA
jgi:hypothetical protein